MSKSPVYLRKYCLTNKGNISFIYLFTIEGCLKEFKKKTKEVKNIISGASHADKCNQSSPENEKKVR